MGRHRKSNPLCLPPRVQHRHGRFFYVRHGKWEDIGTDLKQAIETGRRRNDGSNFGTVAYWFDEWLTYLAGKVDKPKAQRGISPRTLEDYQAARPYLMAYFGDMPIEAVQPWHVGEYLDECAEAQRATRGNREKAALSSFYSWAVRQEAAGVATNPCFGVARNPEAKRDRYVTDAEFAAVEPLLPVQGYRWLKLIYCTLQRPSDVLSWTRRNLVEAGTILQFTQSKTGATLRIEVSGQLEQILKDCIGTGKVEIGPAVPLIRTEKGEAYTTDGLSSMVRRAVVRAKVLSFGPQDMKAKGATDMYLAGRPLPEIQALCGHDSVTTTEIYVKQHWHATVAPNDRQLASRGK